MSVTHTDDLQAAADALRGTPGVVAVDVVGDSASGLRVGAVMGAEYDGIPAHVIHILADHNVTITDVTPQGEPTHFALTIA